MESGIELNLPDTCNLKFWSSSSHASSLQGWFRYGFIDFSKNLLTSKDLIFLIHPLDLRLHRGRHTKIQLQLIIKLYDTTDVYGS